MITTWKIPKGPNADCKPKSDQWCCCINIHKLITKNSCTNALSLLSSACMLLIIMIKMIVSNLLYIKKIQNSLKHINTKLQLLDFLPLFRILVSDWKDDDWIFIWELRRISVSLVNFLLLQAEFLEAQSKTGAHCESRFCFFTLQTLSNMTRGTGHQHREKLIVRGNDKFSKLKKVLVGMQQKINLKILK